jgi:hypothetical protein
MDTPRSSHFLPKITVISLDPFDPILFSAMSTLGSIAALPPFLPGLLIAAHAHTIATAVMSPRHLDVGHYRATRSLTASILHPLPQVVTSTTATTVLWPSLKGAPHPLSYRHQEHAST